MIGINDDVLLDLYKINACIPNDEQGNPLTPFGNFAEGYRVGYDSQQAEILRLQSIIKEMQQVDDVFTSTMQLNEQDAFEQYMQVTGWSPDADSEKAFRYAYKHGFKYAPCIEVDDVLAPQNEIDAKRWKRALFLAQRGKLPNAWYEGYTEKELTDSIDEAMTK